MTKTVPKEPKRETKKLNAKSHKERMLQRKLEIRTIFSAKKEVKKEKLHPIDGQLDDDDEDDFVAVGVAVKKSDVLKDKKTAGKSKSN